MDLKEDDILGADIGGAWSGLSAPGASSMSVRDRASSRVIS
jgi:hypothetical protein